MRNLLLAAILVLAGACAGTRDDASAESVDSASAGFRPRVGRIVALHEVVDPATGERLGFLDRVRYDDGRELFWVRDRERSERLGYIHTNNKAYRYVWHAGQRAEKAEFIGADTISANSRRILGYEHPVELREMTLKQLAAEAQRDLAKARPPAEAGGGAAGDEGEGDEADAEPDEE